jgi:chitodextrinase
MNPLTAAAATIACTTTDLLNAISAANRQVGGGTVSLAPGCTYTMSAINNSTDGNNAFPAIQGNVTVIGNAATITRSTSGVANFRFFMIDEGGSLNLSNLTLRNGSITASYLHGGGAILNRSQLTVNGVSFLNNRSLATTGGGAIDNHDMGQMTVTLSNFTGNVGLQGGAIEDEATLCHTSRPACGQATVTQSTFTNNSTTQYGGGAFESQLNQQSPVLCQPTWPQPVSCQQVGGAHDTLIGNTFSGNTAMTEGGAIANFGTTTLSNSTLYNNGTIGTGPSGDSGGGGVQNTGVITITQSTLSGNKSLYGANIHDYNDTKQPGPPTTTLRMSIVADGVSGQNCSGSIAIVDGGYNLDSSTSCGFSSARGSLNSTNPQLGALQANGGPTQTMALPLQSRAVNAIPATVSGCNGSIDQRGVTRPQGAGCDMGAFEVVQSGGDTQPPTTPTGLATTSVSSGSVGLAWSASTDNIGVAGYTVYRNGSAIDTTGVTTTTYTDSTVAPSTTYTYKVDAFDAAANHSTQSAPVSVTTPAQADTTPPTTPTGLAATSVSASSVGLAWNASTDNVGVTGYTVYRNGTAIGTTGGTTTSYTDSTVAPSTTYSYTVDAFDLAGNHSAQSASVSVTTPPASTDSSPPTVPTGLAAGLSGSTVNLSWNASADNVGVTGYTVYRDAAVLATAPGTSTSYSDSAAARGATHTYAVDAFDAAGNHSAQSAAVSIHVPGVPNFVQGTVVTTGSRVTSVTLTLAPVAPGDLLVGWFGQYDSTGQVAVSDSLNGAWTRSASTTWHGGTAPGDVALYYVANSAAAAGGLTITITSSSATYLQGAASEYSGIAAVNPLDQVVVAKGSGTTAASGVTPTVGQGELVYGGMTATNGPGTLTAGTSQGVTFVKRAQSGTGTQGEEDIVSGAAGPQQAVFSFTTSVPWFIVCAVFRPA